MSSSAARWLRRVQHAWRNMSPPMYFTASFALLIAMGTAGFLVLPDLYVGKPMGFVDALFTATSAVCITGLHVVDTATHFSFWGQLWLLALIELGGLGVITFATIIIGTVGRSLALRTEVLAIHIPNEVRSKDAARIAWRITRFTLTVQAVGAFLLFLQWMPSMGIRAIWPAIFHAVSAFCNAGFSTFSDNLTGFAEKPLTLLTMSGLVVAGGIGYLSATELIRWWRAGGRRGRFRLSTHTYAAIITTTGLIVFGTVGFLFFESEGVLKPFGVVDKIANALVMSTSSRTGGFTTVSYAHVSNLTAYLTILLMVIGGSPGSTAGGVKTTAFAVLAATAASRLRGRLHVILHGRVVPEGTVQRIVSLMVLASVIITMGLFLLSAAEAGRLPLEAERASVLPLLFEAVSAFGSVGLSMGITPTLSDLGKVVVVALMFIGRVGPLGFFAAISLSGRKNPVGVRPAKEDVIVG